MFSKFGSAVSLAKTQGGEVQNSSIGNHSHPNVFCAMLAPQVVISTTLICYHRKNLKAKLEIENLISALQLRTHTVPSSW